MKRAKIKFVETSARIQLPSSEIGRTLRAKLCSSGFGKTGSACDENFPLPESFFFFKERRECKRIPLINSSKGFSQPLLSTAQNLDLIKFARLRVGSGQ